MTRLDHSKGKGGVSSPFFMALFLGDYYHRGQIADSWGLQIFDYYYHGGQIGRARPGGAAGFWPGFFWGNLVDTFSRIFDIIVCTFKLFGEYKNESNKTRKDQKKRF